MKKRIAILRITMARYLEAILDFTTSSEFVEYAYAQLAACRKRYPEAVRELGFELAQPEVVQLSLF
jgi:hypothetical protein